MDNTVTIDGKDHLLAYSVGILVGLGIEYIVNQNSTLYSITKERQRERYLSLDKENGLLILEETTPSGVNIFAGKGDKLDDCKVNVYVRRVYA